MYAPLSTMKSGASAFSADFVMSGLIVNGVSSTMTSLNFVGTWICNSIEGATTGVYSISIVVVSLLLLTVLPVLTGALTLVMGERHGGLTAFDNFEGGDALLYEHLFWVFGHPEVYILIIPAFALVSRAHIAHYGSLFGPTGMTQGVIGIAVVGWVVWAHHMYTTGLESLTVGYFSAATMLVAVPTASKVFHWLGTMHTASNGQAPVVSTSAASAARATSMLRMSSVALAGKKVFVPGQLDEEEVEVEAHEVLKYGAEFTF